MSQKEIIKKIILVYNDEGATSVDVLISSLDSTLNNIVDSKKELFKLQPVTADDIKLQECFQGAVLFVMPGGRDVPYVNKLEGQGVSNIQKFVSEGGAYLGLCAGAYFAASYCEFEKGTDMEVCGERGLKFFPGKACGCVYPGFKYGSEEGSRIVNVRIEKEYLNYFPTRKSNLMPCYYNGGCEFIANGTNIRNPIEVIGRYEEAASKVAIVLCKIGKGKALLSGVHPEMDYRFIDKSKFSCQKDKLELLEKICKEQQILFQGLLQLVLE